MSEKKSDFDSVSEFLSFCGLTVVEGKDVGLTMKDGDRLELRACMEYDENEISVDVMHRRAIEYRGNRGLDDGLYMANNQDNVLGEFPEHVCIVLPGTFLIGHDQRYYLAALFFDGDRWEIMHLPIDRAIDHDDYFVCNEK